MKFTKEEIKSLHSKLKFLKLGEVDFPIVESDTLTLKESILLIIFQYAYIFVHENEDYREFLLTYFLNKKYPEIVTEWPELVQICERSKQWLKGKS